MIIIAITLGKSIRFCGTDAPLEWLAEKLTVTNTVLNIPIVEITKRVSNKMKKLLIQLNSVNLTAFKGNINGKKTFISFKIVALLTLYRNNLGFPLV